MTMILHLTEYELTVREILTVALVVSGEKKSEYKSSYTFRSR